MPHPHIAAVALAFMALARPAAAEGGEIAGSYRIGFTQAADNCDDEALTLERSRLTIESQDGEGIAVKLPDVAAMRGKERANGQFRAEARSDDSPIDGTEAHYSVAGRVNEGEMRIVFIAEYYRDDKPLCTQSWGGEGSAE